MNYCITHNTYTEFEIGVLLSCLVVSCPPPKLPEDWNENLEVPDLEELELMDKNAEELLLELE